MDGVIDSIDAFPDDPAASKDTDGDGYPDDWNTNATAEMIAASTLVLDAFPNDPDKWLPEPNFMLQANQTYYWRVKFVEQNQHESAWSDFFVFSTPENSQDPDGDGIEEQSKILTPVDLDENGVNDTIQEDIKRVKTSVGDAQVGIKMSTGVIGVEQVKPINPGELPEDGKPVNLPYGLVSFRLQVPPGADVEIIVYFSEASAPEMKWYKYDPAAGWYDFSSNAVFNAARTAVALSLTDGGVGDADGVANGVIVDPSGPGSATISLGSNSGGKEDGSGGGGGGFCFISLATDRPIQSQSFKIGLIAILILAFLSSTICRKRN